MDGLFEQKKLTVYCSSEAHSSIEKAVKIIGLGKENLRKIPVDEQYAMLPGKLQEAVLKDKAAGFVPLAVVVAFGTTGSTAIDPLEPIAQFCQAQGIWLHVDAAYAGTALVLPEKRRLLKGLEGVDTFVFNPHKWMFTNFDCSAYFVKDREALIRTFEILPEYLKTAEGDRVNNYRDWGIQLGRRFRALKLWFVYRLFGAAGIREKIHNHICWALELADEIKRSPDFQLMAPVPFAVVCFRYCPQGVSDPLKLNAINARLLEKLNSTGKMYLSHTKLNDVFVIRFVVGQTNVEKQHVMQAWAFIQKNAREMNLWFE